MERILRDENIYVNRAPENKTRVASCGAFVPPGIGTYAGPRQSTTTRTVKKKSLLGAGAELIALEFEVEATTGETKFKKALDASSGSGHLSHKDGI